MATASLTLVRLSGRPFLSATKVSRTFSTHRQPDTTHAGQSSSAPRSKVTLLDLQRLHRGGHPISMMTAYDYPTGLLVDRSGVDVLLVGDSLAMVALGHESTNAVTMDEMLHHCRAVARGSRRAFRVGDMPFGSYQASADDAVRNAVRFVAEGNMEAVKLEGGSEVADTARRIVSAGIPVMGHIGLTPQSRSALGGYRVQGKTAAGAIRLIEHARALEEAGCFSIVLEAIPERVAQLITERCTAITIGIGAGVSTDGQVLVLNDMLGLFDHFVPKYDVQRHRFCKQYAHISQPITAALNQYHQEVRERTFPGREHVYDMKEEELARLEDWAARHPPPRTAS